MGKALYRKYRSRSFDEVVGQGHITKTLKHAIKSGKISHAYLFTGPKGVGKTSVARILAHEVNGLQYKDDSVHLDIIEIDAASNRRIDEIRELRDKVHVTPAAAKYKVYIIDEVHMLTREAFNALLKTLEEPPVHAIFILATTEAHKLPETIISRTQRFTFKPVDTQLVVEHLKYISKKEHIDITNEALQLLAQHGQGSFRDSISLLDQLSSTKGKITEDTVRSLLGIPSPSAIAGLVASIKAGNSAEILSILHSLFDQGMNTSTITKELSNQLRSELTSGRQQPWIAPLLRELLNVSTSTSPRDYLEISLLEAVAHNFSAASLNPSTKKHSIKTSSDLKIDKPKHVIKQNDDADFDMQAWPEILNYAKKHNASLYSVLKLAKPMFTGNTLTLNFEFPLHQKKINQAAKKDLLGKIIEQLTSSKVRIVCLVNKEIFMQQSNKLENGASKPSEYDISSSLKSISNIFGNVEMLS